MICEVLRTPRCALYEGSCKDLPLAVNSVDAIVMDPPAGINFMGRSWDSDRGGRDAWIDWLIDVLQPSFHALKPGGHALAWALPRTSHWTATGLEDLGFEIRDVHMHIFGSGFPKSLDVSKAVDAKLGAERKVVGVRHDAAKLNKRTQTAGSGWETSTRCPELTAPGSAEAAQWSGWGTALKPAAEHWILCRKPLAGTVAANVLQYGTGGLNIDATRIDGAPRTTHADGNRQGAAPQPMSWGAPTGHAAPGASGRWPAHVSFDEEAAAALDEQSGFLRGGVAVDKKGRVNGNRRTHGAMAIAEDKRTGYDPGGGASRFFYVAKPSRREKEAGLSHLPVGESGVRNCHETVKSIALMRWLIRLITPPGGTVLDPFAGSGSTGVAAILEGASFIGVESNAKYIPILKGRIEHALKGLEQ